MKTMTQLALIVTAMIGLSASAQNNCGNMNIAYNDLVAAQSELSQALVTTSMDASKIQKAKNSIASGLSNIQAGLQQEGCTLSRKFTDFISDYSKQGCFRRRNALAYVQAAETRLTNARSIYDGYRALALGSTKDAEWYLQTDLNYLGCQ